MTRKRKSDAGEEHLRRVRRICLAMPECTEKLSHGEATFFVRKKVFAMFANNHPFFRPPYVGVRGWVGIELDCVSDAELAAHIRDAWQLIAPKKLKGLGGRFSSR